MTSGTYAAPNDFNLNYDPSIPSDYPYLDQLGEKDRQMFERGMELVQKMAEKSGIEIETFLDIERLMGKGMDAGVSVQNGKVYLSVPKLEKLMGDGFTPTDLKSIAKYVAGVKWDTEVGFASGEQRAALVRAAKEAQSKFEKYAVEKKERMDAVAKEAAIREAKEAKQRAKSEAVVSKGKSVGSKIEKSESKVDSLGDKLDKKFLKDGSIRKGQEANVKQLREKLDAAKDKMIKSIPERDMKKIMEAIPDHMRYLVGKDNLLTKQVLTEPQSWQIEDYENGRGDSGYRNLNELIKEAKSDRTGDRTSRESFTVSVGGKEYNVSINSYTNKIHYDPKQFANYDEVVITPKGSYKELRFGYANIEGG